MTSHPATPPPVERSVRVRLARVAYNCAALDPDVAGLFDGDGRWTTPVPDADPIAGVLVAADPDGGYAIDVHLTATLVPLRRLAGQVKRRIVEAVAELGLLAEVARVNVHIDGLQTPESQDGSR